MQSSIPDFSKETTLVVVEQKGSDPIECRERFLAGCQMYTHITKNKNAVAHLLVVGGGNNGNRPETIRSWCPSDLLDNLIVDNSASNTHEKGDSILEFIDKQKTTTIVQVTSQYHSLRAFLTTLQSINNKYPKIQIKNYVCDSKNIHNIRFAVLDEILLAQSINSEIRFTGDTGHELYFNEAKSIKSDAGLGKYLSRRTGESSRIVDYSELGKGHLVTGMSVSSILDSYITV